MTGERVWLLTSFVIMMLAGKLTLAYALPVEITLPKITLPSRFARGSWHGSHMIIEPGPVMIKARLPLPMIMFTALRAFQLGSYRQRWMQSLPSDREQRECDHPELEPAEHDRATCVWCGADLTLERL